jgi:2-polyprenyl-3-methyl-5-hydroxy-6-metoxy-1,4-benzoquinol methylase
MKPHTGLFLHVTDAKDPHAVRTMVGEKLMTASNKNETSHDSEHPHSHDGHHDHSHPGHSHDWHSSDYVEEWVAKDFDRSDVRRPILARMMAAVPFEKSRKLRVLDVGCGYGAVSEELLKAFPEASVTLQDYSEKMIRRAKDYLSSHGRSVRYALCDLLDPSWTSKVDGPFDLVVSAIAIHNLADAAKIFTVYGQIRSLVTAGSCFLNCDLFRNVGGLESHVRGLRAAGFQTVDTVWEDDKLAILRAS